MSQPYPENSPVDHLMPEYLATAPVPMYPATADRHHTGARPADKKISIPMLLLGITVVAAAVSGLIGPPSALVVLSILAPVVLILTVITVLTLHRY